MSKSSPKHARPRGKRGNKYTPWIHMGAILSSFLVVVYNTKSMLSSNFWVTQSRVFGLFIILEIAFALLYAFITMMIVDGKRNRNKRKARSLS